MNAYDIFLYLSTFLIVIPMAVFCLFPVIDHQNILFLIYYVK